MAKQLRDLRSLPLFDAVGAGSSNVALSPIFRADPVYARFYRIYQEMRYGLSGLYGDFLDLPIAKTFQLYELWVFLRLLRGAVREFGEEKVDLTSLFLEESRGKITIPKESIAVDIGETRAICFQKQYREFWLADNGEGTFSRTMIPDITWVQRKNSDKRHLTVLDAKYRVEDGLSDALSSIHSYRDALVRESETGLRFGIVEHAYLISPYLPSASDTYRLTPLPSRLFHPEYLGEFRFGAVSMRPGMELSEVASILRSLAVD